MAVSLGQKLFRGQKITLMGLGLLGRGVGDAKFLAASGAELTVTDRKTAVELRASVEQLKKFSNIKFILGEHRLSDFRGRDLIIRGADVPPDSPYLAEAKRQKIPTTMSTALFAKYAQLKGVELIGVTGTRGKSTTTHLLFEILKRAAGRARTVFLGGNVRKVATLPFLNKIKPGDRAVLELDSWQLQGFGAEKISPQLAIFTNFFPDHLNYYHGDLAKYLADKANIFLNQTAKDYLIIGEQVAPLIQKTYGAKIKSQIIIAWPKDLPIDWQIKLPGEHNRYNFALALAASSVLNISPNIVRTVMENFAGVAGRLELIRDHNGVKIYNDTTATTPEATLAGLRALAEKKKVILIMGGTDKNLDLTILVKNLPRYCREIILLPGTGTDKLLAEGDQLKTRTVGNLKEAVNSALTKARAGDIILFSPAFSSFGPPPGGFQNEFDRGDQFVKLIKDY
ncbi:MAG: UDP-N-acetylmuramoyl-L-alanine--D-glutamate ligase [Patescibacteria group bacterium]